MLLSASLSAQTDWADGHLIAPDGRKINGQINDQEWVVGPYRIQFRAGPTATPEYYTPKDLKGFSVANREYISANVRIESSSLKADFPELTGEPVFRDDEVFVQHLIVGEKNLYRYQDENHKEYFLIGEADELTPLLNFFRLRNNATTKVRDIAYRSLLSDYLAGECPRSDSLLRQTKYTEKDFVNLFTDWYDCIGGAYLIPGERKLKLKPGIVAGTEITQPRILEDPFPFIRQEWEIRPTVTFGVTLHMLLPVRRYATRLVLQILYGSYDFNTNQTGGTLFGRTSTLYHGVKDRHLQTHFGLQQDFRIGKAQQLFYAGAGMSVGYSLDHDLTRISSSNQGLQNDPVVTIITTSDERANKYDSGIQAEAGARWGNLSVGLRYHKVLNIYSSDVFVFTANRFQLISQYTF